MRGKGGVEKRRARGKKIAKQKQKSILILGKVMNE
jgi:hypothetical protein